MQYKQSLYHYCRYNKLFITSNLINFVTTEAISNVVLLYVASPSSRLSNGATLAIVAVICSTSFLNTWDSVWKFVCVLCP